MTTHPTQPRAWSRLQLLLPSWISGLLISPEGPCVSTSPPPWSQDRPSLCLSLFPQSARCCAHSYPCLPSSLCIPSTRILETKVNPAGPPVERRQGPPTADPLWCVAGSDECFQILLAFGVSVHVSSVHLGPAFCIISPQLYSCAFSKLRLILLFPAYIFDLLKVQL